MNSRDPRAENETLAAAILAVAHVNEMSSVVLDPRSARPASCRGAVERTTATSTAGTAPAHGRSCCDRLEAQPEAGSSRPFGRDRDADDEPETDPDLRQRRQQ